MNRRRFLHILGSSGLLTMAACAKQARDIKTKPDPQNVRQGLREAINQVQAKVEENYTAKINEIASNKEAMVFFSEAPTPAFGKIKQAFPVNDWKLFIGSELDLTNINRIQVFFIEHDAKDHSDYALLVSWKFKDEKTDSMGFISQSNQLEDGLLTLEMTNGSHTFQVKTRDIVEERLLAEHIQLALFDSEGEVFGKVAAMSAI